MLKTILILLILVFVKAEGMLVPTIMSEASGALCSAGSYYCVVKGFDEWSGSCGNEQDKKRLYSYLGASAGLKAASLVFDAPYFVDYKKGGPLVTLRDGLAIYGNGPLFD
jgi:hypothetical protein